MATDDRNEHRPHDDRNERGAYDDRNERRPYRDDPAGPRSQDATRASVGREHEEYGGVKVGSAFFGWLTAVGMSVLLTALLAAAGAAVGLAQQTDVQDVDAGAAETIGLVSGIILLLVLFLAYYCGGYVAGRMARFDGVKQGLAVWLWALLIAVLIALAAWLGADQFNVLAEFNAFPRIPVEEGTLSTAGIVAAVLAVLVTLGGAILGGMAGARYHRKVDRAGIA